MTRHFSYTFLNVCSRLLNFVLFWVIVNKIGASITTDWFFFVYGFIYFLIAITFYSLECALVPIWPGLSLKERNGFLQACLVIGMVSFVVLQITGLAFSFYVPQGFGFTNPLNINQTVVLSFLLFLQPSLAFVAALYSSLLQANGHYFWPITHLTWRAVGVLVILSYPACSGIFCLAFAYTTGELLRAVVLLGVSWKYWGIPAFLKEFAFRPFKHYFVAIGWTALMVCSSTINVYIDFIMVGRLGDGLATLVEYGGRLRGLPILALSGVLVVFLGDWSRGKGEKLAWQEIKSGTFKTVLWAIAFSVLLIISRQYWIPLIFRNYQFTYDQISVLESLMAWYLVGAPFMVAVNMVSRGFLVWKRFKVLSILGVLSISINIIFNLILIKLFGVTGVAMSTTGLDAVMLGILIWWGRLLDKRSFEV